MIPAVIISPDVTLAAELQEALVAFPQIAVVRKLGSYPAENELVRMIRANAPHVIFVGITPLEEALRVASIAEGAAPGIQIVAFDRESQQSTLLELMRAGIREFIAVSQVDRDMPAALLRLSAALERKPPSIESTDRMFTFVPAKPGVGCSTVALNAAIAAAAGPDQRTLLMDFDLSCGMIGFLLHLDESRSIVDAAEHAPHMDETLWPKLVYPVGNLDVLPTGNMKPHFRLEPAHVHYLLEFARRNYQVLIADLSGLMEKFSIELMQQSKRIYLVCTPELPALHLARQKMEFFRTMELEGQVSLVLNRAQRRAMLSGEDIRKMLGVPVEIELPNDYRGVHKAFTEARPVDPGSDLGKGFRDLARHLSARGATQPRPRRFVDYFNLVPARYSFGDAHKGEE